MLPMSETIQVNFGRPTPLFPLPDTVLLPHALLPLHIFEPRYRQMISHCLNGPGLLAVATFDSSAVNQDEEDVVRLRSAVCVGHIIQHDTLPDGRYNLILHGVCRAKITHVLEPEGDRRYRLARLAPIEPIDQQPDPMPEVRQEIRTLLTGPRLKRLRGIETLLQWIDQDDVPTHALLELIGFALVRDTELRYQLLAEADPQRRAGMITHELKYLDTLVHRAEQQDYRHWPKGMSWN